MVRATLSCWPAVKFAGQVRPLAAQADVPAEVRADPRDRYFGSSWLAQKPRALLHRLEGSVPVILRR